MKLSYDGETEMIIITLDTSCLNPDYPELDELAKLSDNGKIKLYFEIPSEVETENWKNEEERKKMLWWKNLYTAYHLTTFKAGETPPLVDKRYGEILHKVMEIHSPGFGRVFKIEDLSGTKQNSIRVDCKLLAEHIFFGGQYFITRDKKGFINSGKKEKFEKEFDIKIRFLDRDLIDELNKEIIENELKT